jgi:quercetin dioxygenase-like cupin family protein
MTKPASTVGGAAFDLVSIEREMREEETYLREGHSARTLTREHDLRIVLVVMKAGSRIAEHQVHETASIHALRGHLQLQLGNRLLDLPASQLLVLEPGLPHGIEAVVESSFLLTLGWPQSR